MLLILLRLSIMSLSTPPSGYGNMHDRLPVGSLSLIRTFQYRNSGIQGTCVHYLRLKPSDSFSCGAVVLFVQLLQRRLLSRRARSATTYDRARRSRLSFLLQILPIQRLPRRGHWLPLPSAGLQVTPASMVAELCSHLARSVVPLDHHSQPASQ